ncbi:MAG: hypothetical protein IJM30_10505 [Thermoguttaceae bacterium]|nr:hypothetical protein [Thermoguttaceae bacterium]
MGEYHFYYPRKRFDESLAGLAFLARGSLAPSKTSATIGRYGRDRDVLSVETNSNDSRSLCAPFVDADGSFFFVSTSTLRPSARPYSLYLELCRGQLERLAQKECDWFQFGFLPSSGVRAATRKYLSKFAELLGRASDPEVDPVPFDRDTFELFKSLCATSRKVNEQYLSQILRARRNLKRPWSTKLGFGLSSLREPWLEVHDNLLANQRSKFYGCFNAIRLEFSLDELDSFAPDRRWGLFDSNLSNALKRGLRPTIGPLVRWGERGTVLPSSLPSDLKERELRAILDERVRFVEEVLVRDAGRTKRWIVATNVESTRDPRSFEARLWLAGETALRIRRAIPGAVAYLGFEQPFGDAARRSGFYISPYELAARVARRDAFDGFYLEMNFGLTNDATLPRDPLEIHRFFDRWCGLGRPIILGISHPCDMPTDTTSDQSTYLLNGAGPNPAASSGRQRASAAAADLLAPLFGEKPAAKSFFTEGNQRETVRRTLCAALARRNVEEIVWSRLLDVGANDFLSRPDDTRSSSSAPDSPDVFSDSGFSLQRAESTYDPRNPDRFPASGLFDENDKAKPILHKLASLWRAYID